MGWLGWSYEQYLNTPIPIIELAIEGKVDFIIKTNPMGGGEKEQHKQANMMDGDW